MCSLFLRMASNASSWQLNSTSASPIGRPLRSSNKTLTFKTFNGLKNYKNKQLCFTLFDDKEIFSFHFYNITGRCFERQTSHVNDVPGRSTDGGRSSDGASISFPESIRIVRTTTAVNIVVEQRRQTQRSSPATVITATTATISMHRIEISVQRTAVIICIISINDDI